ncbi:STAS domain-containing protein [Cellulomonas xylanilytica]|uniref:STAS domain-containing protein n=1 Tax=Cellulomonas xylanilytica TaxID=233583 RepID=UPI0011BEE794|nr:STAS domain-containing protein [Cellulomonas xylanilytica]
MGSNFPGTVHVTVTDVAVQVTLTGDIDVDLTDELDEAGRTAREHRLPIFVDAVGVSFMDSAGARFIGRCYGHGPLTVAASPPVRLLLKILAMDDVLTPREPS